MERGQSGQRRQGRYPERPHGPRRRSRVLAGRAPAGRRRLRRQARRLQPHRPVASLPGGDPADGSRLRRVLHHRLRTGLLPGRTHPHRHRRDDTISRWSLTAEGTVTHTTTVSHYTASAGGPLALDAAGRTLARGAPPQGGDIVYLWILP